MPHTRLGGVCHGWAGSSELTCVTGPPLGECSHAHPTSPRHPCHLHPQGWASGPLPPPQHLGPGPSFQPLGPLSGPSWPPRHEALLILLLPSKAAAPGPSWLPPPTLLESEPSASRAPPAPTQPHRTLQISPPHTSIRPAQNCLEADSSLPQLLDTGGGGAHTPA